MDCSRPLEHSNSLDIYALPKSGVYHFALTTEGKAVVRLHDALVIDADSRYTVGSKALSGEIALRSGSSSTSDLLSG